MSPGFAISSVSRLAIRPVDSAQPVDEALDRDWVRSKTLLAEFRDDTFPKLAKLWEPALSTSFGAPSAGSTVIGAASDGPLETSKTLIAAAPGESRAELFWRERPLDAPGTECVIDEVRRELYSDPSPIDMLWLKSEYRLESDAPSDTRLAGSRWPSISGEELCGTLMRSLSGTNPFVGELAARLDFSPVLDADCTFPAPGVSAWGKTWLCFAPLNPSLIAVSAGFPLTGK